MSYEEYYNIFRTYFRGLPTYKEIFEEGKKIEKALSDAKHQTAQEMWYERGEGDS